MINRCKIKINSILGQSLVLVVWLRQIHQKYICYNTNHRDNITHVLLGGLNTLIIAEARHKGFLLLIHTIHLIEWRRVVELVRGPLCRKTLSLFMEEVLEPEGWTLWVSFQPIFVINVCDSKLLGVARRPFEVV